MARCFVRSRINFFRFSGFAFTSKNRLRDCEVNISEGCKAEPLLVSNSLTSTSMIGYEAVKLKEARRFGGSTICNSRV